MKTIEIKGKKYKLTPVEEKKTQENRSDEAVEASILDGYGQKAEPGVAQPKKLDIKKVLAERRAVFSKNSVLKIIPQQDADLGKFGSLVIGEGVTQSF